MFYTLIFLQVLTFFSIGQKQSIASGTLGMPSAQHMMSSKTSLPASFAASTYVSVTMILTCAAVTLISLPKSVETLQSSAPLPPHLSMIPLAVCTVLI